MQAPGGGGAQYLEEIILSILVGVVRGSHDVEGRPASKHLVQQNTQGPPGGCVL